MTSERKGTDPFQPGSALRDPLLLAAIVLGAFVRLLPTFGSDFPIGDGGLIAAMVDNVVANGLIPPYQIDYNGRSIPFAYPPAAIYLAALPAALGVPTLELLRILPVAFAILAIPAWYLLARELFGLPTAGIAAIVYALTPKSYEWLIAGGGLTRGLGLLFVLLGLTASLAYFRRPTLGRLVWAGILLGFGALSHPEAGVFGLATIVLFGWHRRSGWRSVLAVGAVAVVVAAPWLVRIAALYGITPFVSAGGSRAESYVPVVLELASLRFTHEPILGAVAVLGAIGAIISLTSGRVWILAWILVCILLVPAAALTLIMLAWSALAAMALTDFVAPRLSVRTRRLAAPIGAAFLILGCAWSPVLPTSPIWSVSPQIRQAATHLSSSVPLGTRVVIVTGSYWPVDAVAEWFPYLSGLRNASTVQGLEFTDEWSSGLTTQEAVTRCAHETARCLVRALMERAPDVDLVILPKGRLPGHTDEECCRPLRESLRSSGSIFLDSPGATVFRVRLP
jgi:hypothetical protein